MSSGLPAGTRLIERPGSAPALALRAATVTVVGGPDQGRSAAVGLVATTVGASPECDLVLADETVSAQHLELRLVEQGCLVRDVDSSNGTFLDGHRVREIVLARPSELVIGATRLAIAFGDATVEVALSRATNFGGLLGHGPAMRAVFGVLEKVARTEATVLVLGESGTGKELAARAVHERSPRKDGPYVVFDCAAATPNLLESQLFGHVRGAFTGAVESRAGVFEEAHEGTLVLDEIGELPLDLQPKLLRALESRTVQRVGESKRRDVSVRFVACTNRNLEEEVRAGRFREDLFFRLSVIAVRMPPLRERPEEIPRLARHFALRIAGDDAPEIPDSVLRLLQSHAWPGNVRELRNFVERYLALPDLEPSALLGGSTGPRASSAPGEGAARDPVWKLPFHDAKARLTDRFERDYLVNLLDAHGDNLSEAARVAGLSRQSCYRLMHKHGLRTDE